MVVMVPARSIDSLSVEDLKKFCDSEGITVSYCSDGSGYFWVSGKAAHDGDKGPFQHKEPTVGNPESLQEAFMDYIFKKAGIKSV
jgi:hypothetical protein